MRPSDRLFAYVWLALLALMILWGVGTIFLVVVQDPSEATQWRLITVWSTQFTGVTGLALGYLAGTRKNGNGNH